MDLQFGQIYGGKYRLLRLLGTGGMGAVYEGENVEQRRRVAIKTLHKELAAHHETLKRFEREAEAASRIGSDHITRVMELGQLPDGSRFIVMEFLEGVTLRQRMRDRGRLPAEEAVRLVSQILEGLAAAHAAGIVHRDLKPANVFLVRGTGEGLDFVKILDFGVSKLSDQKNQAMALTSTGVVVGTPHYMAPEQAKGSRDVDARADLYATGVILYECLAGQLPFHATTFNELIFKIVLQPVPPVETFAPDVDPELATIVVKAMAKEPTGRFQSAQAFHQALSEWLKRSRKVGGASAKPREVRVLSSLVDDEPDPVGDNGTVIMRRQDKQPFVAAPPPPPPPAAPPPPPPPSGPIAQAPASAPRPKQASAPTVAAQAPASALSLSAPERRLAPIVAVVAFAVVFVIGGALMLLVRMARDSSDDAAPAPSASAAAPAPATGKPASGAAADGPARGSEADAPAPASPPSTSQTSATPRSSASAGSPPTGKRRTISTDL
jgi:eukaryotic-like serine/threonine-protein kinase